MKRYSIVNIKFAMFSRIGLSHSLDLVPGTGYACALIILLMEFEERRRLLIIVFKQ